MSQKPIVAVLLSSADAAEEVSRLLADESVDAAIASTSDELYRLLNHQRVDLVVIDHDLAGFLTGLEILERLYHDLLRPATLLLGELPADAQARARSLGVDQIIARADPQEIVAAAAGVLAATRHGQVLIPPAARQLVARADKIQPLPQLLVRLSRFLEDDKAPIAEIAADISVDPKVTAELLKLINSTAFGMRRKMTNVADAVSYLGIRRTVSLVLSACVVDSQLSLQDALPDDFRRWYNSRSVLIASTASVFARRLEDTSPDTAYIVGLLQDIGMLVLAQTYEQRYLQLVERVRTIPQLRIEVCERDDFGLTHAEVSAALLQKWKLPQSLISLVFSHHPRPHDPERSQTEQRFLRAARIGEAAANLSDRPSPQRYQSLNRILAEYGLAKSEQCKSCLAEAVAKTAESSQLLSVPVPDEEQLRQILGQLSQHAPGMETLVEEADRQTTPATPEEPVAALPQETNCRKRVLVIDDEEVVCQMIRRMLQSAGFDVLMCETADDVFRHASDCAVVLCDVHLRDASGTEIVRQLRNRGYTGAIITVSGDHTRATVVEAITAGIDDFLIKPFDRRALLEKIEKWHHRKGIEAADHHSAAAHALT